MRELTKDEIADICGGRKFFNVIVGAAAGAFNGAAVAIAKEGAEGLIEITNGTET